MTRSAERDGFTLIEMMIVVVIIAVLAAVAIVAYTRHIRSGRLVAAKEFISAIQSRQEQYFQQWGYYCNASGGDVYYPVTTPAGEAVPWSPPAGWADLGARPVSGHTYFQHLVRASVPPDHALTGFAAALGIPAQPAPPGTPSPWYYVVARGDLDGSGVCADPPDGGACTLLYSTSARSEIVSRNEGQ